MTAHVLEQFIRCSFTFPRLLIDNKQARCFSLNFAFLTHHLASNMEWFIFVSSKGLCLLSKAYNFGLQQCVRFWLLRCIVLTVVFLKFYFIIKHFLSFILVSSCICRPVSTPRFTVVNPFCSHFF